MVNNLTSINSVFFRIFVCILFVFPLITGSDIRNTYAQERRPLKSNVQEKDEIPDWLARWELAKVLSYTKRYGESVTEYKKLLKDKPNLYEAKVELAKVLFWQGKNNESLSILEEIPTKHIDDNTRMTMVELYAARKEYTKAEPLLKTYLEKHPSDVKTRLKLAEILSWDKRYDESIAEYNTILNIIPGDVQVRRKYAFTLIWAGKRSEAAIELKKTLR